MMTTAQAAADLGVSAARVRQLAKARRLGVLVTNRLRLFTPAEVDAMRVRTVGYPKGRARRPVSPEGA